MLEPASVPNANRGLLEPGCSATRPSNPTPGDPGEADNATADPGRSAYAEKLDPHPQELVAFGLLNTNPRPMISSLKSTTVPLR